MCYFIWCPLSSSCLYVRHVHVCAERKLELPDIPRPPTWKVQGGKIGQNFLKFCPIIYTPSCTFHVPDMTFPLTFPYANQVYVVCTHVCMYVLCSSCVCAHEYACTFVYTRVYTLYALVCVVLYVSVGCVWYCVLCMCVYVQYIASWPLIKKALSLMSWILLSSETSHSYLCLIKICNTSMYVMYVMYVLIVTVHVHWVSAAVLQFGLLTPFTMLYEHYSQYLSPILLSLLFG